MKTLLLSFLLLPTFCGCGTRSETVDVSAEFPITIYPDMIYVPVTIGTSEHLCVLDSGTVEHIFHTTLRQKLGASLGPTRIESADDSISVAELFKGPDARIGAIALTKDTPTLCYDLSSMREASGRDIEGFVGLPLFKSHIVQMDFDAHRILILPPSVPPISAWGEPMKLAYNEFKQPTVRVEFGAGITEQCVIDTGYGGPIWLSSELYAQLLNKKRGFAGGEIPTAVVAGHRMVHVGGALYMKIGSVEDRNVAIRGGGTRSRIGLDYLRQFRVTIDIPHDRIYLAKGAEFDKPGNQPALGIGLLRKNRKTVVTWIDPNSPKEEARIAVNDELMTLAGEPIAGRPLEEIKWMLREKAGPSGKLKLTFRRGDQERKVEVTIREPRGNKVQAAAIAEIRKLGGKVTFDDDAPGTPVYAVDFSDTHIGDDALRAVEGLRELKVLYLSHTKVTDAGLKHIEGLTELGSLLLHDTRVTDAGLKSIKGLTKLTTLLLDDTRVTDAGLEHVKGLVHLEFLALGNTQVTDAGLKQIGELPELYSLSVDNTRITDEGLKQLKELKHLERLYVIGTKVTFAGVKELEHALPNLHSMGSDFSDIPR